MKPVSLSSGILFCLFSAIACRTTSTTDAYSGVTDEESFVMVQLGPVDNAPDSLSRHNVIKAAVETVKKANTELGYKVFEKKIASFEIKEKRRTSTYLTIRPFSNLAEASTYAQDLKTKLPGSIYGSVKSPFPITQTNYKRCVEDMDFHSYSKNIASN